MANKHSRQGLALGVSLALGATTLGVLPAQAVDYENLSLTIAADDTNGVLATTMENDFQLELEWDISDVSDLAYLTYDVEFNSADESVVDSYGAASGISWDAGEDDIVTESDYYWWEDTGISSGDGYLFTAPAHVIGDDETATYRRTVTQVNGSGVECSTVSTDIEYTTGNVPGDSTTTGTYCGDINGSQTTNYSYLDGYTGSLDEPAPAGFESILSLDYVWSEDDYVDVTVNAWLDKDGDEVRDATESYAAPVTIRFWNPTALTPELVLDDEGVVWGDDNEVGYTVYILEELNEYYTSDLTYVDEDFFAYSDLNYDATRDGHVYQPNTYDSEDLVFGFDSETYDYKHVFTTGSLVVDMDETSRVGVADYTSMAEDSFFPGAGPNVYEIVAGSDRVTFVDRTVEAALGHVVESSQRVWVYGEDASIHESLDSFTYIVELQVWDEEESDYVAGGSALAGVDATVVLYYYDNDEEGDITINGESIIDAEDAVDGSFELDVTSNANGELVLEVVAETPIDDLYLFFDDVVAQNALFDIDGDILWEASEWTLQDELNSEDSYVGGANSMRHVEVGASTTITYNVVDQFFQAPANNTMRVEFEFDGDYLSDARDFDGYFDGDSISNVVNGKVAVTIPDVNPDAGEGTVDVWAYLYMKDDNGGWTFDIIDEDETRIEYVDDAAVAAVDMTEDATSGYISYVDFIEGNFELERWTATDDDNYDALDDSDLYGYIEGYVDNADGLGLAGKKVTLSANGVLFSDDNDLWGVDSLTVMSDDDGFFYAYVWGHVVGEHTITISSGGKSTTATFEVTADNVRAHNVSITSPFAAKAGTADTLTALVTDRYGNVAADKDVTFSKVSGSGYIEAPATSTTDEDGVATATLVVLGGEIGFNSTVSAAIEQDDFAATANAAAAQRSAGDTNVGKTTAWTKLQTDGTAKMYAKNIVGAGKVQFFHNGEEIAWVRAADALNPKLREANGAFYLVRTVELVDGKNVLEVYIDGERVRRTAYTK